MPVAAADDVVEAAAAAADAAVGAAAAAVPVAVGAAAAVPVAVVLLWQTCPAAVREMLLGGSAGLTGCHGEDEGPKKKCDRHSVFIHF